VKPKSSACWPTDWATGKSRTVSTFRNTPSNFTSGPFSANSAHPRERKPSALGSAAGSLSCRGALVSAHARSQTALSALRLRILRFFKTYGLVDGFRRFLRRLFKIFVKLRLPPVSDSIVLVVSRSLLPVQHNKTMCIPRSFCGNPNLPVSPE